MLPENSAPAPVAPTPVEAPKMPTLNSDRPLSQQTNQILKIMDNMPEKGDKKESTVSPEPPVADPAKVEEPEETPLVVDNSFLPEDDEERHVEPLAFKTWQEYVTAGVQPLTITGKVGDELREFKVFTEDQLPADFQFNSDVDRLKYSRAFDRLERKAEGLQQEFYQKQQQENVRQFEVQEAKDISSDLTWLQSRGVVPKFKFDDNDPRFNSDDAVKEANAIYDLYKEVNNAYAQRYMGTNRSYRISYRDAADKFYAMKGRETARAPKVEAPKAKTPIEQDRDKIAGKVGAPQGGDAHVAKPRAFQGMTMTDINRLVRANKI